MHSSHRPSERGIILWSAVFIVLVLGGLSAAFLFEGLGEKTAVEHRRTALMALQICEAGALRSQMEILALHDADADGMGDIEGQLSGGTYKVVAVQDTTYPDRWTVRATGTYRLSTRRVEIGIRRRVRSDWAEGLYARDQLRLIGDMSTDSYDSRAGTYAEQAVNVDAGGTYAGERGHVGSNGGILATGSAIIVRGNAIPGPQRTVEASGSPTILGDQLPRRNEIPLPVIPKSDFQAALFKNDNANLTWNRAAGKPPYKDADKSLTASGRCVVTLPGGTYLFSDVVLSGHAELHVTGPSIVYVTGRFDLSGGALVNSSGVASDLMVYAHPYPIFGLPLPTHPEIKLTGGPSVALALYAPEVDLVLGGDDHVYGALVGREVTVLGNASVHYDEALRAWHKVAQVFLERLYWREMTTPTR